MAFGTENAVYPAVFVRRETHVVNVGGGCRDKCTGYASVAQSVEQGTENPRVIGSIPIGGTTSKILSFIGKSCKQDFCDEYQIFFFSPQTFASQIFAGAPITQKSVISMRP